MAININAPQYFTGTGSISFSSLSSTFKGASAPLTNVRFSQFRRDTESEQPIVPDATENANIPTAGELSARDFRNSINKYDVTIPSTDTESNVQFYNYFNNNLNKNVPKVLSIAGKAVSSEVNKFAAEIKAEQTATNTASSNVRNLDVNITGDIYGAAGGGGALYVESGGNNRRFNITIQTNGKVWAGGVNGNPGNGGSANSNTCTYSYRSRRDYSNTERTLVTVPGYNATGTKYSGNGRRCDSLRRGSERGWSGTRGSSNACSLGYTYWVPETTVREAYIVSGRSRTNVTLNNTITGTAGNAGSGGVGQGWTSSGIQNATQGNSGNPGSGTLNCSSPYSGPSANGNSGNSGNPGAGWGSGAAIKYRGNISLSGFNDSNKAKGSKLTF